MAYTHTVNYRDIVTSHLREDTRILTSVLAMRRIFQSPLYEIYVCIYSGLMDSKRLHEDLVTCLIVYRKDALRIMIKLWTDEIRGDRNAYIESVAARLRREGKGPFHLVCDAKIWCRVPFTRDDHPAMVAAAKVPGATSMRPSKS